jgi:hypothetical protein
MSGLGLGAFILFVVLVAITWWYFFRNDIARYFREFGPRRQLAREMAQEREAELQRLRDELAAKYLADGAAKSKPPAT